jgi:hypothetical protein
MLASMAVFTFAESSSKVPIMKGFNLFRAILPENVKSFFFFLLAALAAAPQAFGMHPADTTEDGVISVEEMTAYVGAWKNGETWSDGSPTSEDAALQAIYIWRSGERYREIAGAPLPFAWVPNPGDATYLGVHGLRPEPLDVVELFDLPVDVDTVSGVFTVFGQEGEFPARFNRTDEGAPALVVPFNPYDPLGEGRLTFTLTDGEATWRIGPIELQPLPAAPGEIVLTRNAVVSWIEDFGTSVDADITALLNDPIDEVPAELLPAVALLHEINGPEVADNLDALLDGSAPSLQGEPLELDLYERILAKLDAAASLPPSAAPSTNLESSESPPVAMNSEEPYHKVSIEDGVDLAELMRQQATAERTLEMLGKAEEVVSDLSENMDRADGYLEKLLDLHDNGAVALREVDQRRAQGARENIATIKSAKRAASYIGWFTEAVKFINYYNNGILPNRFLSMSVNVTGPDSQVFSVEDNCSAADVSARVDVASQPLTYGAEYSNLPDLLQGRNLPDILPSFEVDVPTGQVTFGPTGVSIEGKWVPEFVWTRIELAIGNFDNTELLVSVAVIEPDFPFVHQQRTDGPGTSGRVIGSEIHPDPARYTGETGTGTVHVSAKADLFGGKTIQQSGTYGLRALNPLIFEYPSRIAPGEAAQLRAEIANASTFDNEAIEWEVTNRNGDPVNAFIEAEKAGEVYLLDLYETPLDEEDYPLQVVFRSTTTECLRGSDQAPPRESRVFIRAGRGFQITPGTNCLLSGEQLEFAAEWPDGEIPENIESVVWSIEAGGGELLTTGPFSVSYTAPDTSGLVVLRAEVEADADNFATRSFTVNCNFAADFTFERDEPYLPTVGAAQPDRFNFNFFEGAFTGFYDDWIPGAVEMHFDEVVAIMENRSRAIGTFAGIGIVYSQSEVSPMLFNFAYETDDSGNMVEYPRPDSPTRSYTVTSGIGTERSGSSSMRITDGGEFEIRFEGDRGSFSEEDIVAYQWNASSGSSETGEVAALNYPKTAGNHWVELVVTDSVGNTARQLKWFSLVEIEGRFSFSFADDRGIATDPPPDGNLPGNFLEASSTGSFSGNFAHGGPIGISIGQIDVDLYRFQVRYHATEN